jgi:hypothetical protein
MRYNKYLLCLSLMIAVVFFLTQPSRAQIPGVPKLYGEFKMPEKGAYAIYKVINTKNKTERIIKLAIVGQEKFEEEVAVVTEYGPKPDDKAITKVKEKSEKGKDLYWYEVVETNPKTGNVVIAKMLISGNPQEIGTIHRMIVKSGKDPASELPPALIQLINQTPPKKSEAENPKMKNLGTEKVQIKKETVKCEHVRYSYKGKTTAEVWTNSKVPLFGLVKSTSPDITMELSEYGTDAVSAIKEKPEILEMPGLK